VRTKGDAFCHIAGKMALRNLLEASMFELLKSLVFAVVMVPVMMAVILGLIYGLGELFNLLSAVGHNDRAKQSR
jgi:hypothetical protein